MLLLLAFRVSQSSDSDGIFTSNVDLQRLLKTEEEIVRELHDYISEEEQRLDKLKQ